LEKDRIAIILDSSKKELYTAILTCFDFRCSQIISL